MGRVPAPPRVFVFPEEVTQILPRTEQAQLEQSYAQSLATWAGGPYAGAAPRLTCLQASAKTSVYQVEAARAPTAVAKFHRDRGSFERERLGLTVADSPDRVVPSLLGFDDERQLLLLEHLPHEVPPPDSAEALAALALVMGKLHRAGAAQLAALAPDQTLAAAAEALESTDLFRDREAARACLRLAIEDQGEGHVGLMVGDLKQGHARRRDDGSIAFLDFENFIPGMPEVFDVLMLLNVAEVTLELDRKGWATVIGEYLAGRDAARASPAQVDRYGERLALAARAVGRPEAVRG